MRPIPEKLVNFRCYLNGADEQIGLTDVELPSFEAMKETISGAGIAGEISSVVLGHFKEQMVKLKWRVVTAQSLSLLAPVIQTLDLRGSIQYQDPALGLLTTQAVRVSCTGQISLHTPGKLEAGKQMGAETDMDISAIRVSLDGVPVVVLDKLNFIFIVDGVDYLQKIRQDMGGV